MNYQLGSKSLVRLKFCGMTLRMRKMKSEKLLKATSWRLSGTSGSKFVVSGLRWLPIVF